MKTTNKLLIGLAIALFVIPVGGMVINVKSNRINALEYEQALVAEVTKLNTTDRYFVSEKVPSFDKVSIVGGQRAYLSIYLVKSAECGFKIYKEQEGLLTSEVDDTGNLALSIKDTGNFFNTSIYIYAPSFENLQLSSVAVRKIVTNLETLKLGLNEVQEGIDLTACDKLKNLDVSLNASNMRLLAPEPKSGHSATLENVKLNLINSTFALDKRIYESVVANLDNSSLLCMSDNGRNDIYIKEFDVNTKGSSSIGFFQANQIGKLTGTFSDSTTILMPIAVFKNILKK